MAPIPKSRRVVSIVLASWLLGVLAVGMSMTAQTAFAAENDAASSPGVGAAEVSAAACAVPVSPGTNPCEAVYKTLEATDKNLIKPVFEIAIVKGVMSVLTYALDKAAYEAAIWVSTGFQGGTPLFNSKTAQDGWTSFGLDVAGEAMGQLADVVSDSLETNFNICSPADPAFKLALSLGIKQAYKPEAPKCNFKDVMSNWDSFISTTVATATNPSQTILKAFADGFRPGQNELSASVKLNLMVHQKVLEKKTNLLTEMQNSDGFKSVTNVITGQVETPSSLISRDFEAQREFAKSQKVGMNMNAFLSNPKIYGQMALQVAGVFTNTLLSTVMNKVYTGLFTPQAESDPFDAETSVVTSREEVAKQFSYLLTSHPSQIDDYNVLNEFVTCPSGGVGVRSLTQCVMDQNFSAAILRAESGTPLTVQQAVDEGLLNASWTLIPNDGEGVVSNQDLNCYTYGYCYSNLVKLRKARVLPVGWEIAASVNDAANPNTLQEIIDGFNDSGSTWYHLIDPNWVLKYPQTQCRAVVNGDVQISTMTAGRTSSCVDTPSCIAENNDGTCTSGYGYCMQEKNVWKFKGTECPAEAASCMIFNNTDTSAKADFLLNTVDFANCNAGNAGCLWYRTNKYFDDAGTVDDTSDDTYSWLPVNDAFVTADREDDIRKADLASSTPAMVAATAYSYDTTGGTSESYDNYSYQDRVYYNNDVSTCDASAAGCTGVYKIGSSLVLNLVQNPSFEVPDDESITLRDNWSGVALTDILKPGDANYGNYYVRTSAASPSITQENIRLAPNSFYTLSFYEKGSGGTSTNVSGVTLSFTNDAGDVPDLRGTSSAGDCVLSATSSYAIGIDDSDSSWTQKTCTFTTASDALNATIRLAWASANISFDTFQLELGENASAFTEGYNSTSPTVSYLLLPPAYLNCTGAATDAAECASYTQICTAQNVGCNLYSPDNGDPSIPAIASTLDACPSECVGYASYKQEATDRQVESFPLYFIADRATACSAEVVGCDSFTNLDATDAGGEGTEYYTDVRACLKTSMTSATDEAKQSDTYFTWEGSDASGYQLVTWTLLKSNFSSSTTVSYSESSSTVVDDTTPDAGPCVSWIVNSESDVSCNDAATGTSAIEADDSCNEHADIFANPNCREFFDGAGSIHYREYPSTISISDDCHPYRFTSGTQTDCEDNGGFWTSVGDCRYFGLPAESVQCDASSAGCRSYTGGGGRNASTVYEDTFEDGALTEYSATASATVSNESVATGGHSMRVAVASTGTQTVSTVLNYLDPTDHTVVYDDSTDDTKASTCTDNGGTVTSSGCEITSGSDVCAVANGDSACGPLIGKLVQGKTYQLNFWAKGSGSVTVAMIDGAGTTHDLVDTVTTPTTLEPLVLDAGWHEYALGPLDTSSLLSFDDTAVLSFSADASVIFYLDNLRLKALEDSVTVIQDSWVVPSTCDSTPDGAPSAQYYLGCQAYTDQNGATADLYQFSSLCSEDVVGCEAAYDTQNSDSAFAMTYNARCVSSSAASGGNLDCVLDGDTVCSIGVGETYCLFDRAGTLPSIFPYAGDGTNAFSLELGPEAVAVDGDTPMYVVDNGTTSCTAENAGCQEIGLPTYDQAKENVTAFASTYVINDPDDYSNVLCENRSLFCAEWSSTQDGNFYFKDPGTQTCEYKTNVTVDGNVLYGWFKTGTDEACDPDYVKGGSENGIWRNGDDAYANWVGTCTDAYDLCTEFLDTSDTSDGNYVDGTPYNFINDDTLSDESLTASDQCGGQVSQKFGCALFDDTTDSTFSYATLPSYLSSTHADTLYGSAAASKVDPVSCKDGGEAFTTPAGDSVNLCNNRCRYAVPTGVSLEVGNAVSASPTGTNLVSNGDFETSGGSGWDGTVSGDETGTVAFSTDSSGHGGSGSALITGYANVQQSNRIQLSSGATYTFSFYQKTNVSDTIAYSSRLSFYTSATGSTAIDMTGSDYSGDCSVVGTNQLYGNFASVSDFERKTCSFTMPSLGYASVSINNDGDSASNTLIVDDVTLQDSSTSGQYAGACLTDVDCPALIGDDSVMYSGACTDVSSVDPEAVFANDANRVMKVYRDRECAEWSNCGQSRVSWNTTTNKYDSICEQIVLCNQTSASGDQTTCTSFPAGNPVPLTPASYAARDVTWAGNDYSGYTIPGVIPLDNLTEINVQPDTESKICFTTNDDGVRVPLLKEDGSFNGCSDSDTHNCTPGPVDCATPIPSLRLAYDAGTCDQSPAPTSEGWGGSCTIGYCEDDHSQTCYKADDCGTGITCVTGFCQIQGTTTCTSDDDCTVTSLSACDPVYHICVDDSTPSTAGCFDASSCGADVDPQTTAVCRPSVDTFNGTCLNDQCIVGADGIALILEKDSMDDTLVSTQNAEESTCRGYPEVGSPFSPFSSADSKPGIVEQWVQYGDNNTDGVLDGTPIDSSQMTAMNIAGIYDPMPYTYVSGFQGQNVCAPDPSVTSGMDSVLTASCDCSYTKVTYGNGYTSRYYSTANADSDNIPPALCMGGSVNGMSCSADADCGTGGTCTLLSRKDTFNGWQGYCLERDLSINLYGNPDEHPCITWLPVDALAGATDLYGKASEAGFPLENEYYCSQTGFYVDLYPTGAVMEGGYMTDIDWACASVTDNGIDNDATSELSSDYDSWNDGAYGAANCTYGQYDGCDANVVCPTGFVGVVGYCNQNEDGTSPTSEAASKAGDVCNDATAKNTSDVAGKSDDLILDTGAAFGNDDCPYFCVPINSTHTQSNHGEEGGKCDEFLSDSFGEKLENFSTEYYRAGNLFMDKWPDNSDTSGATLISTIEELADCGVRGLPYVADLVEDENGQNYDLNWHATEEGSFASGFSPSNADSEGKGGYAFKSGETGPAYGIAHRVAGAEIHTCNTTGALCTVDEDCRVEGADRAVECGALCASIPGFDPSSTAFCFVACMLLTDLPDPDCVAITETNNISGDIWPYLGCYEVSQTAVDQSDPSVAAGGTYNKAWTNRLMNSSSAFETSGQFKYKSSTIPSYAGQLPFQSFYTVNSDSTDVQSTTFDNPDIDGTDPNPDAFPLPVQACSESSEITGIKGIDTSDSCSDYAYPGTGAYGNDIYPMGVSYEDIDVTEGTADELYAIDQPASSPYLQPNPATVDNTTDAGSNDSQGLLTQFFESVIRKFTFDYLAGTYNVMENSGFDDTSAAAVSDVSSPDVQGKDAVADDFGSDADADAGSTHRAPTIMSVGYCKNSKCEEGTKGAFSVNSQEEGNVFGSMGQAFVSVSFYAYANPNQMPIRNINVDWGNSKEWRDEPEDWPHDKMGGSTTNDNFYKNYRGYNPNGSGSEMCNPDNLGWGGDPSACQTGYVTFTNSYTCTATDVAKLEAEPRLCELITLPDGTEVLKQSPCTGAGTITALSDHADGACVFQPRVSVLDNWGWCTGSCDGGSDDTGECYEGDSDNNECDIQNCPGSTTCNVGGTVNPWINFNGFVVVTPP